MSHVAAKNEGRPKAKESPAGRWISYRPEIKVLDCTIRDGGLMNNHQFPDEIVRAVYDTCVAAGVDYMELGYKASRKGLKVGDYGAWKFCREEDLRRIVGDNPTALKLSVLADAEKCDYKEDIPPRRTASWTWSGWPRTSTRFPPPWTWSKTPTTRATRPP